MKIAYLCYWDVFGRDGVTTKIGAQVAQWRAAGHDVTVACLSPRPAGSVGAPVLGDVLYVFSGSWERIGATRHLRRALLALEPDVVYARYDLFLPPLSMALDGFPAVVELNSDDRREAAGRSRAVYFYNELNRRLTLRRASGLVSVTDQIARLPHVAQFVKPTVTIGNGMPSDGIRPVPAIPQERPTAVMLIGAANRPWIGVDKLVTLAETMPDLAVHIVGDVASEELPRWPPNLVAHPHLERSQYAAILARCDFGIGPLALHRIGVGEASSLKVREYLWHGLPVLLAGEDTDFAGQRPWFLHRIANAEPNVQEHADEIRLFARRVRGRRVTREEVAAQLSVERKEATRLAFLERIAGSAAAPSKAA